MLWIFRAEPLDFFLVLLEIELFVVVQISGDSPGNVSREE